MVMRRKHGTTEERIAGATEILSRYASFDEPIGSRTTYRVGGKAALFVSIEDEISLERVATAVGRSGIQVLVIGNGSNMLISDKGFNGLCISLGGKFAEVVIDNQRAAVEAGGGASYPIVARQSAAAGLTGMEWAVGIPGTVGGAVAMNAGGHGSDTAERLVSAHVVGLYDRTDRILTPRELNLGYRSSVVSVNDLVLSATFFLELGAVEETTQQISDIVSWRREHQPGGRNAGSIFKNPKQGAAGQLIESVGLKGFRLGTASVSDKHANFIQVDDNGKADDVHQLIRHVQLVVRQKLNIELKTEVRMVGFDDDDATESDMQPS